MTLLPKSITTAIGMGVSDKMGGIVTMTVVSICITGILGNIAADKLLKWCKIEEPIARGLAIEPLRMRWAPLKPWSWEK